jgi:hypothetical protein
VFSTDWSSGIDAISENLSNADRCGLRFELALTACSCFRIWSTLRGDFFDNSVAMLPELLLFLFETSARSFSSSL